MIEKIRCRPFASLVVTLLLAACGEKATYKGENPPAADATVSPTSDAADSSPSDATVALTSDADAEAELAEAREAFSHLEMHEEAPIQETRGPEWTIKRTDNYRDFEVIALDGTALSGAEFEDRLMCKNAADNVTNTMWALRNLRILVTRPGLTTFVGRLDGTGIEVSLVLDEQRHVPTHLLLGSTTVVWCEHSLAYP